MITVDELVKGKPIYVKNKSKGDFLLTLYRGDGSSELVPVPKTFIPICVTNFAEPDMFRKSSDFRRAVSRGLIEIISSEQAITELKEDDAKGELERIRNLFGNIDYAATQDVTAMEVIRDIGSDKVSLKVRDIIMRSDISDD